VRGVLSTMVPLYVFMLIPVWIPIIAVTIGAIADRLRPPRRSPAQLAVETARARSAQRNRLSAASAA
jgi:hypothetical protein